MPRRADSAGVRRATGSPLRRMRPPGSGSSTPEMILISVLLPDPFSPTRQWISPGRSVRSTPRRAWTPAKRLAMPASSRKGTGSVTGGGSSQALLDQPVHRGLVDRQDLVELDQLGRGIDLRLAQAGDLHPVLDLPAVQHLGCDRGHGIARVDRVPEIARGDR